METMETSRRLVRSQPAPRSLFTGHWPFPGGHVVGPRPDLLTSVCALASPALALSRTSSKGISASPFAGPVAWEKSRQTVARLVLVTWWEWRDRKNVPRPRAALLKSQSDLERIFQKADVWRCRRSRSTDSKPATGSGSEREEHGAPPPDTSPLAQACLSWGSRRIPALQQKGP